MEKEKGFAEEKSTRQGQFMTDTVCIVVCTLELTIIR